MTSAPSGTTTTTRRRAGISGKTARRADRRQLEPDEGRPARSAALFLGRTTRIRRMTDPRLFLARPLVAAGLLAALTACTTTTERTRLVRAPARCADQTVQLYFEPQSSELTKEGRDVIAAAAAGARACKVMSVEVIGLADAAGAPGANLELSQKR